MAETDGPTEDGGEPPARIVGRSPVKLWGMTTEERLRRSLVRAGGGAGLVLNAEWVFDESLVRALAARPGVALLAPDSAPVAAHPRPGEVDGAVSAIEAGAADQLPSSLSRARAEDLVPSYNAALRKREAPLLRRLTPDSLAEIEKRMFAGSYKGVTDLVTKYLWPTPALHVTRWCAQARMTPNQVTFIGFLLVLAAFALFWTGHFGWGLLAGWGMTFLDTVDGKLARVTLTSSKIGNAFDHGIDLVHPPFWWWAWIVGLHAAGWSPPISDALLLILIVGGYVLQRLQEGLFIGLFKIEIHIWRRFDSAFRLITTRRNPNLILLTAGWAAGRPDLGLLAVAAWTLVSVAVHGVRILQALVVSRGKPLASWMAG
jgi:phosphatidylglycerophosphate synthase